VKHMNSFNQTAKLQPRIQSGKSSKYQDQGMHQTIFFDYNQIKMRIEKDKNVLLSSST
jgi:hypothetical protein